PSTRERLCFARCLGNQLALLHAAGFDHPDLYAKHVLVNPCNKALCFLDWQRSGQQRAVRWSARCRDLAALHATLHANLAGKKERLICLRAYLRKTAHSLATARGWWRSAGPGGLARLRGPLPSTRPMVVLSWQTAGQSIERQAQRLLKHRHVRD